MMKGNTAMFFNTYFCFFHSYFNLFLLYYDFFSWSRFKSFRFSQSILCSCFFRNEELRLLPIRSLSWSTLGRFIIELTPSFCSKTWFYRYIYAILSNSIICFFFLQRVGGSYSHHPVVFGRYCLSLSICPSYSF